MSQNKIKKIAVLGGGISSISAIWKLTNDPDWKSKYEITLYQMGWRIGGKGASGRNPEFSNRIEEHGLHLWFGCYHNAFHFMNACYEELNRNIGEPVYCLEEAFQPSRYVTLFEEHNGVNKNWHLDFKFNSKKLGKQEDFPTVWENVIRMVKIMMQQYLEGSIAYSFDKTSFASKEEAEFYRKLNRDFMSHFKKYGKVMGIQINDITIDEALDLAEEFLYNQKINEKFDLLLYIIEECREWLWDHIKNHIDEYDDLRRMWILFDLTMGTITGVIKDDLHNKGLQVINHLDFREWISPYTKTPKLTAWSAPIQAMYSLIFCGKNLHTFEAGTCLRCIFRVALDYNQAFFYRMQAGMGDIVFTPAFEVLKRRGVKFKFFHKVESLNLSEDKKSISKIVIGRQVTLKHEDYDPFILVKGLKCWPSRPNYEQIIEGEELLKNKIDLEEQWNHWENKERIELKKGVDFDQVLLGISIGALPYIAKELIDANKKWQKMIEGVTTTPTQALQVWLKPDIRGLGWEYSEYGKPLVGNFIGEMDTWADLSNIIKKESWHEDDLPQNLAYFCGKLNAKPLSPESPPNHHKNELEKVKKTVMHFFDNYSKELWPKSFNDANGKFNSELLSSSNLNADDTNPASVYFRANLEPTEQYVLAERNASECRIKAGETGFENLIITGDWIDNGWNAGCIEATVTSGLQAARAIEGDDYAIIGEIDLTELSREKISAFKNTTKFSFNKEMLLKIKKFFQPNESSISQA